MNSNTLFERCHVNTNIEDDVFVGIQKKDDYYEVNFPLGFHLSSSEKELRKDIITLMNVLARSTDKRESRLYNENNDNLGMPIQSYLYLIKDYYERGYYKEKETFYECAKKGKINWGRTIKTQKPYMEDNEPYYLNFIVKKSNINEDELITLVHKYCVYESFDKLGWLFTSFVPQKPKIGLTHKMMISVVRNKLQNTFNDKNKQLFTAMLSLLKNVDSNNNSELKYGTNRFEYVWEKMIDRVFGIAEKNDYFPKTSWNLSSSTYDNSYLEPDTIMLHDDKIYVLDAKYYKYGWTGYPGHLPESTSINKQITYGEYIAANEKFSFPTVYNAFLMPYDSNGKRFKTNDHILCIGHATSDWKDGRKKYENVIGVLLDIKYLMNIDSRQDPLEILKLANIIEDNCPV
jgi:hypothetical protein